MPGPSARTLTLLYAASYAWVAPIFRAAIAVTAAGCTLSFCRGRRLQPGIAGLLLIALPVISSLQFVLGYPLRAAVGWLAAPLRNLTGFAVVSEGACLNWGGELIAIDAPCSGVRMLWAALFLTFALADLYRLGWVRTGLASLLALVAVLLGNTLRAASLFYLEAGVIKLPAWSHEGAGVVEAVGRDVTTVRPGDHVVACLSGFCGTCEQCLAGHPNLCVGGAVNRAASAPARLSQRGLGLQQFAGIGSYAEKMLLHENSIVKIDRELPLDRAALVGCGVLTGVGAALRTRTGRLYTGVNVENAAYPQTMCAERVAIFKAVSDGETEFEVITVVTDNGGTPCGGCRQVMAEFGLDTIVILADGTGKLLKQTTVKELLPDAFTPDRLGKQVER